MIYEKKLKKKVITNDISSLIYHVPLIIWSFIVIVPILLLVFASFKTNAQYAHSTVITPPDSFLNFKNYYKTLVEGRILKGLKNSFILIIFGAGLNVLISATTAYCLHRFDFFLKKYIMALFVASAIIPNVLLQVIIYKIMFMLKLTGTFGAPILLYATPSIIQIWIYIQFLEKIPPALDESAMIDGASYFRVFIQIIFPLLAPATATVLITQSVFIYSDMFTQYLYCSSERLQTATTALMTFSGTFSGSFNIMAAGCVAVMVPTLVLFLFFKRFIFAGLTVGAVKE